MARINASAKIIAVITEAGKSHKMFDMKQGFILFNDAGVVCRHQLSHRAGHDGISTNRLTEFVQRHRQRHGENCDEFRSPT
jgi:hypothetical protein